MMTLANIFTLFRLVVGPLYFFVFSYHEMLGFSSHIYPIFLLCLLLISEASDAFDGYLARKFNQVTDLGKVLDPMADSISHISIFLTFTQSPIQLPLPFVLVFIYRDSIISTLRIVHAMRGEVLPARVSGKIKAAMQGIAAILITALLIPHALGSITTQTLQTASYQIMGVTILYTLFSGVEYLIATRKALQGHFV